MKTHPAPFQLNGSGALAVPGGFTIPGDLGFGPAMSDGHGHGDHHKDVFRSLHRLLRGRYVLASVLGVLGAVGGAAIGYLSQRPMFRADAMIHMRQFGVTVIGQDPDEWKRAQQFSSYAAAQVGFLQSSRVLSSAMDHDEWKALARPLTPESERAFRESLKVSSNYQTPGLLEVSFTDETSAGAYAGLRAIVKSYNEIVVKTENTEIREAQYNELDRQKSALTREIESLLSQNNRDSDKFGTSDLASLQNSQLAQRIDLEKEIGQIEIKLAGMGIKPGEQEAGPARAVLSPIDIAARNRRMAAMLERREQITILLDQLLAGGATEAFQQVVKFRADLKRLDDQIKELTDAYNSGTASAVDLGANAALLDSPEALTKKLAALRDQLEVWKQDSTKIKTAADAIALRREDIARKRMQVEEIDARIKTLRADDNMARVAGPIDIHLPERAPTAPAFDRRLRYAAIGLVLGGLAPFGLVALLGLMDRRFLYSDQAKDGGSASPALLGILPELPKDLHDPEQAAAAAHCVHQMRTMLQIGGADRRVYAVTSATSGDGKTSLTLSMGLSFAASGAKTLLIDLDLIGQGLSAKLKIRPEQGTADALETGHPHDTIVATKVERLYLLAAGRNDDQFVPRLGASMVHRVIEAVRPDYDVIIVDTGPILGSLEANFICSQADGVILVVGRGQQRSFVQRASEQLAALRARVVGLVFNRAVATDFNQSSASASFRSVRSASNAAPAPNAPARVNDTLLELDPVSRTVALDIRK